MSILAFAVSEAQIHHGECHDIPGTDEGLGNSFAKGYIPTNVKDYSPNSRYLAIPPLGEEHWASLWIDHDTVVWVDNDMYGLRVSLDSEDFFWKACSKSNEDVDFYLFDGADYHLVTSETSNYVLSYSRRYDFHYKETDTEVTLEVYIDRNSLLGSLTVPKAVTLPKVTSKFVFSYASGNSGYFMRYGSVFFSDEDSRYITMVEHSVDSFDESHTDFSNGGVEYINDTETVGDRFSLEPNTATSSLMCNVEDRSTLLDGGDIVAVGIYHRQNLDNTGADAFQYYMHNDLRGDAYGSVTPLDKHILPYQGIFETAPDGSSWTHAIIGNTSFGIKMASTGE